MPQYAFLPTLRELVRCYQAFEAFSNAHIRSTGLTPPQFDIIATLGNTQGMTCKELGQRTLITKGTLTGVLDRLEARGLIQRLVSETDRRSQTILLTPIGNDLFQRIFPAHMAHTGQVFADLGAQEQAVAQAALRRLRQAFTDAAQRATSTDLSAPSDFSI